MAGEQSPRNASVSSPFDALALSANDAESPFGAEEFTVQKHNSSSIAKALLGVVCVPLGLIACLCLVINASSTSSSTVNKHKTPTLSPEATVFLITALVVMIVLMTVLYQYHATSKNQQCIISSTHIVVKQNNHGRAEAQETRIPLETVQQVVIRADSLMIETRHGPFHGPEQQQVQIHGVVNAEQVCELIFARQASTTNGSNQHL